MIMDFIYRFYLTIKSIIQKCDQSFHICLIDDRTFGKLIPGWNIQMDHISSPITDKIRKLGLAKLIYMYGGMVVPLSFLCMKDLISMYEISTASDHMFICENNDKNVSSTKFQYYPDLNFMGAKKETEIVNELIQFMEHTISVDYTAESEFLGKFDKWCESKIKKGRIKKPS